MNPIFERISKRLGALPPWAWTGASAIAATLLVNYFFCPRFALWKGLDLPLAWSNPEVNRAVDSLRQIQHPFAPINNPTNEVIQWRLLFPLLAHFLKLPDVLYLALSHVGGLLSLLWIARLTLHRTSERWAAFAAAALFGTTSWYFVSMGWLAYFDS